MKYIAVLEPTETGFSVYVPDLPGCVSTGRTREEAERNIREALAAHIDLTRQYGEPIPPPGSSTFQIELA
jgi:predicted RNase H-like HicB family nuclease